MPEPLTYPRFSTNSLEEALSESPAVLLQGSRQCGKSTLAQIVGEPLGYTYLTFDDENLLSAATADPQGFVSDLPEKTTLDEIQRVPELFRTLKAVIDKDRRNGRFILTGSANILLLPRLSESLSGRMEIVRLHPLSQSELRGERSDFLTLIFDEKIPIKKFARLGSELADLITAGGYPAALARKREQRRSAWYRDYIETQVLRDVRDLANVASIQVFPRLLAYAATQTGHLLNVSDLASPFQVSRPTINSYLTILESLFLLELVQPWHSNRVSRLVRSPKIHLTDTGVACSLLGVDAASLNSDRTLLGQLLETFVLQELRREASWFPDDLRFFHYRDRDGGEVDIVIERGSRQLVGIEVKASATVVSSDFNGIRRLRERSKQRFTRGIVLYDGETSVGFGDGLYAVPIRCIWEGL